MSHDPRHPADRHDPLAAEERALADRLARLGPHGEPSPALDARILDAARAAVGAPASTPASGSPATRARRHRRRRWPVAIGTAATLVVVGGLAWQLRPVDDIQVVYSEAPRAVSGPSADAAAPPPRKQRAVRQQTPAAAETAAPAAAGEPDAGQPSSAEAAPMPAPPPEPVADTGARHEEQPAPAPASTALRLPPPPAEPPVLFDEPSPMDTPAPAPAPPALPAPPAPAPRPVAKPMAAPAAIPKADTAAADAAVAGAADERTNAEQQRARKETTPARRAPVPQVAAGTTAHPAAPATASAAAEASELDSIVVTGARIGGFNDQPIDDEPPASADSPQVQDAWLRRVRQLVSEGRLDDARESLREYRHRYPKATLPEDLRPLLAE